MPGFRRLSSKRGGGRGNRMATQELAVSRSDRGRDGRGRRRPQSRHAHGSVSSAAGSPPGAPTTTASSSRARGPVPTASWRRACPASSRWRCSLGDGQALRHRGRRGSDGRALRPRALLHRPRQGPGRQQQLTPLDAPPYTADFSHIETCLRSSPVNVSRLHPLQRSRSFIPAATTSASQTTTIAPNESASHDKARGPVSHPPLCVPRNAKSCEPEGPQDLTARLFHGR
jgi:hypothetical protein